MRAWSAGAAHEQARSRGSLATPGWRPEIAAVAHRRRRARAGHGSRAWWLLAPVAAVHRAGGRARSRGSGTVARGARSRVLRARARPVENQLDRRAAIRASGFAIPNMSMPTIWICSAAGRCSSCFRRRARRAGERTLAAWLLAPGEREAGDRAAKAVAELRTRIDLREELALMGEDIRAAVDAASTGELGRAAAASDFFAARAWLRLALACAAVVTLGLWFAACDAARCVRFCWWCWRRLVFSYWRCAIRCSASSRARGDAGARTAVAGAAAGAAGAASRSHPRRWCAAEARARNRGPYRVAADQASDAIDRTSGFGAQSVFRPGRRGRCCGSRSSRWRSKPGGRQLRPAHRSVDRRRGRIRGAVLAGLLRL